jgi:hypothetical protein
MTRKLTRIVLASAALVVISVPAFAAGGSAGAPSWGPRFGVSVDPDQLVIGGQYSTGQIAPSISFVPNLELGFGDHQTDVAINLDGHYHFKLNDSDWAPYLGFGVCIDFVSFDRPAPAGGRLRDQRRRPADPGLERAAPAGLEVLRRAEARPRRHPFAEGDGGVEFPAVGA